MPRLCLSTLTLAVVEQHNVSRLQVLLAGVLPVSYPDAFYKSIVKGKVCAVLAQEGERVTGGMAWNIEVGQSSLSPLCLITLCCLHSSPGIIIIHKNRLKNAQWCV